MHRRGEIKQLRRRRGSGQRGRRYSRHATELLQFFAEHRTAWANQVQRRFADLLPSDRSTRLHLQTLVAHGDLLVQRQGSTEPNVYEITRRGLRAVRDCDDVEPSRRRATGSHRIHELLITEVATLIAAAVRHRSDLDVPWEQRWGLCRHRSFRNLIPDYAFLLRHRSGLIVSFVEVSSGEESPTRIGEKLQKYADWAASPEATDFLLNLYRQHGALQPRPHFRLLVVAQNRRSGNDEARKRQVLKECAELERQLALRVWVTTVKQLAEAGSIDAAIWSRAADLATEVGEWNLLSAKERRQQIAGLLNQLDQHRLFPADEGG